MVVGGARHDTGPIQGLDTVPATGPVIATATAPVRPPAAVRARPRMEGQGRTTIFTRGPKTQTGWHRPRIGPGPGPGNNQRWPETVPTTSTPIEAATSTVATTTAAGTGATRVAGRRQIHLALGAGPRRAISPRPVHRPAPNRRHVPQRGLSRRPDPRRVRVRRHSLLPDPDRRPAAAHRAGTHRRRTPSTAITLLANEATRDRASTEAAVGPPAVLAVAVHGGDKSPTTENQKVPSTTGPFFY